MSCAECWKGNACTLRKLCRSSRATWHNMDAPHSGATLHTGESEPSFLYTLRATSRSISLYDGRTSRAGGPRNANDARGLGVPQTAILYDNSALHVRPFCSILPLRPDMSPGQRKRAEILCKLPPHQTPAVPHMFEAVAHQLCALSAHTNACMIVRLL